MSLPSTQRWEYRGLVGLPIILCIIFQVCRRGVCAVNPETYCLQDCLFFCLISRRVRAWHCLRQARLAGVGNLRTTFRARLRALIDSQHSASNHGLGGLVGFGDDLGMVLRAILSRVFVNSSIGSSTEGKSMCNNSAKHRCWNSSQLALCICQLGTRWRWDSRLGLRATG